MSSDQKMYFVEPDDQICFDKSNLITMIRWNLRKISSDAEMLSNMEMRRILGAIKRSYIFRFANYIRSRYVNN